jgi:hypothetical protein
MNKVFKILGIAILMVNILAIDGFLFWQWNYKSTDNSVKNNIYPSVTPIPTEVSVSPAPLNSPIPTIKVVSEVLTPKTKSVQYIPIPGNGSTLENTWTNLPGTEFYISTDDYPNLAGAYFEANMKLLNGNGLAYLRLFDITAGIEVWGSEISTNSQDFTSVSSGKMTVRNGTHLYRVQAKSLTADTTIFNSGRIKVILEN